MSKVKKYSCYIVILISSLLMTLIMYRKVFVEQGFIVFGDNNFNILSRMMYIYTWAEYGQRPTYLWGLNTIAFLYFLKLLTSLPDAVIQRIGIVLIYVLAGFAIAFVTLKIIENEKGSSAWQEAPLTMVLSGTTAAFYYMTYPLLVMTAGIKSFISGFWYAALPLQFYCLWKLLETSKFKYAIYLSILNVLSFSYLHSLFFFALFICIPYTLLYLVYLRTAKHAPTRIIIKNTLLVFSIFLLTILLNAHIILPYIYILRHEVLVPYYAKETGITVSMLKTLSGHQTLVNVFRGLGYFWPVVPLTPHNQELQIVWYILSWITPFFVFLNLFFSKTIFLNLFFSKTRNINIHILYALLILFVFLSKGCHGPFGNLYIWLATKVPLPYDLNWLFRAPSKFLNYLAFTYSILIGYTIYSITDKVNRIRYRIMNSRNIISIILALIVMASFIGTSWPVLSGNFNGVLHSTKVPKEYSLLSKLKLEDMKMILWVPPHESGKFIWSKVALAPDPISVLSPLPYYDMHGSQRTIWNNIMYMVNENDYNDLLKYLKILGIKYVALRFDAKMCASIANKFSNEMNILASKKHLKKIFSGHYLQIYEINNVSVVNTYILKAIPIYMALGLDKNVTLRLHVPREGYYLFVIESRNNVSIIIDNKVQNNVLVHNHYYFVKTYLGKGVHTISIKVYAKIVALWTFTNKRDVEAWEKYTPKHPFNALQVCVWDKTENALKVMLYNSTWGWKTINSPLIPASYHDIYLFSFLVKAVNGYDIHCKIIEYNSNRRIVHVAYVRGIGSGTFNWRLIKFRYSPKDKHVAYIQLQIWHGHLTREPLPNIIWIKDVRVLRYSPFSLWIYLIVKKSKFNLTNMFNKLINPLNLLEKVENTAMKVKVDYVNPTLWIVKLVSNEPFLLTFARAYDPLWEARVYIDNKLIEKIDPIPVYGVINGFWINATSNLTIVIRYTPQDWFELGLKISVTTFALCILYLVWDWRRERGDRWALWLEKRVRSIPKYLRGCFQWGAFGKGSRWL